jgi:hypothetical protein
VLCLHPTLDYFASIQDLLLGGENSLIRTFDLPGWCIMSSTMQWSSNWEKKCAFHSLPLWRLLAGMNSVLRDYLELDVFEFFYTRDTIPNFLTAFNTPGADWL